MELHNRVYRRPTKRIIRLSGGDIFQQTFSMFANGVANASNYPLETFSFRSPPKSELIIIYWFSDNNFAATLTQFPFCGKCRFAVRRTKLFDPPTLWINFQSVRISNAHPHGTQTRTNQYPFPKHTHPPLSHPLSQTRVQSGNLSCPKSHAAL